MTSLSKQKQQERYEHFISGYSGRKLLSNHSLTETGTWRIYGEDPNCDMGGVHIEPDLGLIEGMLDDVIREAVSYGNFFAWGGGGRIEKYSNPKVKKAKTKEQRENAEYEALAAKRNELEAELARVNKQLKALQ
jgi:hypothetical protein